MIGTSIVGAGTVAEAIGAAEARRMFRMILLDLQLPDARGYSGLLALQYRAPQAPTVVVAEREEPTLIEAARALGAAGFLSKRMAMDDIADRLRRIDAGQSWFPPAAASDPGPRPAPSIEMARARISNLSPAQHNVLMALADGRSNKRIARDLDISEATVKAHMTAIFRKMGVQNRTQALLALQPLIGSTADA